MLSHRPSHANAVLRCLVALIAIVSANTGHAAQTRKVLVTFVGDVSCIANLPAKIGVVLDGDEKNQFLATQAIGSNLWIGDWSRPDLTENFDAVDRIASIRVGGARTDCRRSYAAQDPQVKDGWVASFTFRCDTEPVQKLEIRGEPDVPISYVRRLPKVDDEQDSRGCVEHNDFLKSPVRISDVWFDTRNVPSEALRIQVGSKTAKIDAPGLLVNHPSVMKYAKGGDVALDQEKLLTAFGAQRAEGLAFAPPLFSPNAYEDDRKRLEKLSKEERGKPRREVKVVLKVQ